jgi:hypothetical protein
MLLDETIDIINNNAFKIATMVLDFCLLEFRKNVYVYQLVKNTYFLFNDCLYRQMVMDG